MLVASNGIRLDVEDHGPRGGRPLLLVMGLGVQMLAWPDGFVDALVARGFRVVRFDNRDIGLSDGFEAAGRPSLALGAIRFALGLRVRSAYGLADMAADCVGILDALGIDAAHVCGASMGGMIAQHIAARHGERVSSLTLMMTTSGARGLPPPSLKVLAALLTRPRGRFDMAHVVEHYVRFYRRIASPAYPLDEDELRAQLRVWLTRSYRPDGALRQGAAVGADGDRSPLLAAITQPTHVVHGLADPFVPAPAARDLAAKIAGATLDLVEGMGHDLPPALWPRFVAGIEGAADRSEGRGRARSAEPSA